MKPIVSIVIILDDADILLQGGDGDGESGGGSNILSLLGSLSGSLSSVSFTLERNCLHIHKTAEASHIRLDRDLHSPPRRVHLRGRHFVYVFTGQVTNFRCWRSASFGFNFRWIILFILYYETQGC
jgi:hypothetical protein